MKIPKLKWKQYKDSVHEHYGVITYVARTGFGEMYIQKYHQGGYASGFLDFSHSLHIGMGGVISETLEKAKTEAQNEYENYIKRGFEINKD